MPDATTLVEALQPMLPLQIRSVEFASPSLVLVGDGWSLALLGEWTWRRDGTVVTGWDAPSAEDAVRDLCDLQWIGAAFPDPSFDGDCTFLLSEGTLDVRSDRSGYETWTFRHDDLDVVFVGL